MGSTLGLTSNALDKGELHTSSDRSTPRLGGRLHLSPGRSNGGLFSTIGGSQRGFIG